MRREFRLVRVGVRGRSSSRHSYKDTRALIYLATLAVKYNVDSRQFFKHILEAWKQEESKCEQIIISCREKTDDSAIFLFTTSQKVVAQFPISTKILREENQLEDYVRMIPRRASSDSILKATDLKIEDLKAGMKHVNLNAEVLEVSEPQMITTNWGFSAYISNAIIADETGIIKMSLWNKQIRMVSKGDSIRIENSEVVTFRGERQLRIGRKGILSVAPQVNGKKKGY
ncbi:MAG: hypothetical protein ACETWE_11950 [Candidatus Bathyarchaeia archaeon]